MLCRWRVSRWRVGGHRQPPSRFLVGVPLLKSAKGQSRSSVGPIVLNRVDTIKRHDWERLGLLVYHFQSIFSRRKVSLVAKHSNGCYWRGTAGNSSFSSSGNSSSSSNTAQATIIVVERRSLVYSQSPRQAMKTTSPYSISSLHYLPCSTVYGIVAVIMNKIKLLHIILNVCTIACSFDGG